MFIYSSTVRERTLYIFLICLRISLICLLLKCLIDMFFAKLLYRFQQYGIIRYCLNYCRCDKEYNIEIQLLWRKRSGVITVLFYIFTQTKKKKNNFCSRIFFIILYLGTYVYILVYLCIYVFIIIYFIMYLLFIKMCL